ncbi:TonB-dependent receptor [candidate division WOR-3 bacterium]|nr:TonB-dependent receptor [candidate division WOR-3 bacterium]
MNRPRRIARAGESRTGLRAVLLVIGLAALTGLMSAGQVRGRIIDSETGEPLPFANIIIENTDHGAATDLDGDYHIAPVPAGDYVCLASMLGYADSRVTGVKVAADGATRLDIALSPRAIRLDAVAVTAERARSTVAGLLSSQQRAPTVSSGISAEQISKAPDARASDVLKRVTGLSVVDGKYVFVRGLNERYSSATLNGSTLPSPEPDRRVVPFDIFPSGLLDDIVITKTFAPNLPGEFAGGSIRLTTKDFPDNRITRFGASGGMNSGTTFRDFATYHGGALDFLGFDNGTRRMPAAIRETSGGKPLVERGLSGYGFTEEELERFGESFANVWSPVLRKAPMNGSFDLTYGDRHEISGRPLGYLASLTYKNSYSFRDQESTYYYVMGAGDTLEPRHSIDTLRSSQFDVLWGGIFNVSYKPSPAAKLGFKTTYTRSAQDEVVTYYILPNRDHNLDEMGHRLRWIQRSLLSTGLSGEHSLSGQGNRLDWRANYALATRDEPDTREVLYEAEIGSNRFRLADETNSGSRFFSSLTDHNADVAADWTSPFKQWSSLPSKLVLGGSFIYKNRAIDSRRFRFKPQDWHGVNTYQDPELIFSPENIRPDGFQLEEDTRPTDNYGGMQLLGAGYAMVDMPLVRNLRLLGGARVEHSFQRVRTYELFNPTAPPLIGLISKTDLLPSLNLTWAFAEEMNLRAAFARTVSRPSFRELSPFEFTDVGGYATVGDTSLKRAVIHNYDLRWEWYPATGEHLSFAVFYKHFTNPIEVGLENATEITWTWRNALSAYNWRFELEAGVGLHHLAPALSGFGLSGNLALVESHVVLDTANSSPETNRERPLQGQSPYVVNLGLEYRDPGLGLRTSLMYNVSGRRIAAVGKYRTPDYYEEPVPKLDFTVSQRFLGRAGVKLSAGNLLDAKTRFTQGGKPQRVYRTGRSFSLGVSYSL